MMRRPKSLATVLGLAAVSLLALAFTGLMEWVSAVLFLVMEFLAEFLRPLLERPRPRRPMTPLAAAGPPAGPAPMHRVPPRRGPLRRPRPRLRGRGRGVSPC